MFFCIRLTWIKKYALNYRSWGCSVSIVSDYGLDNRVIEIRSPAEAKEFLLSSVPRPARGHTQFPVQRVPGVLSPGVKGDRGVTLTTHTHLVPKSIMSRSYTSPPKAPPWRVVGLLYFTLPQVILQSSVEDCDEQLTTGYSTSHSRQKRERQAGFTKRGIDAELRGRVANTPASFWGSHRFISRPGVLLYWLRIFAVFFSPSKQMPG
jgi:hypothetical protein